MRRRSLLQALAALPGLALLRDRRPRVDPPRETWHVSGVRLTTVRLPPCDAGAVELRAGEREAIMVLGLARDGRHKLTPGQRGLYVTTRDGWERVP